MMIHECDDDEPHPWEDFIDDHFDEETGETLHWLKVRPKSRFLTLAEVRILASIEVGHA